MRGGFSLYNEYMNWATKRQVIAISIFAGVLALVIAAITFFFFYTPASCIDLKQNQDETGIDCGGSCSTLCTSDALPARISFVRVLTPAPGRTDVIAYIDNPNEAAEALGAHLTLDLYADSQAKVGTQEVTLDLPAQGSVPLYLPNVGNGTATKAFLTFVAGSPIWTKTTQKVTIPVVQDSALQNTQTPRITATLKNPVAQTLRNITIVATVFDENNNAIGATQTFVSELPSQGTASIVFNWNTSFINTPVRYEIVPVPKL